MEYYNGKRIYVIHTKNKSWKPYMDFWQVNERTIPLLTKEWLLEKASHRKGLIIHNMV